MPLAISVAMTALRLLAMPLVAAAILRTAAGPDRGSAYSSARPQSRALTMLQAHPAAEKRITCGGGYGWSVPSTTACPPPQWEPAWAMNLSTVTESAANMSGFYDAEKASQWGVITMDWQDGAALWQDALPGHTGEQVLVEQCKPRLLPGFGVAATSPRTSKGVSGAFLC